MALLKFSCKIDDGLLYEGKPVDRPVGRPPKRKSLHDVTEGKGWRVVKHPPQLTAEELMKWDIGWYFGIKK